MNYTLSLQKYVLKIMKSQLIKPVATALWLIKNTKLTFSQIAKFCLIPEAEIEAMADGFEKAFLESNNPIKTGQLTVDEITRCEADSNADLQISSLPLFAGTEIKVSKKSYTPMSQRRNKLSGALFLLQNYKLTNASIMKLTGTTKRVVEGMIDGTLSNLDDITPKDPILLGLCTQVMLNEEINKNKKSDDKK